MHIKHIKIALFLLVLSTSILSHAESEEDKLLMVDTLIKEHGIDYVMEIFVAAEQNEFPLKKDALDTILTVFYIKGTKAKVYKHAISAGWIKIFSDAWNINQAEVENFFKVLMKEQSINSLCSHKLNRLYFDNGVKIINHYSEQDGTFIFSITVNSKSCNK